ncbi:MAG: hypothetical protein FJX76_13065 [Armatimonadetes bacterium]|nr:hypothetical protein [Armatimonadota bacterium]
MPPIEVLAEGLNLAGKYQVLEPLDEGEAYRRYLVRDSINERPWVLTQFTIPDDEAERKSFMAWFYAEGDREAELQHAQLPLVAEFFMERGYAWTVTQRVEGKPLEEVLETPLESAQARAWLLSLARVLVLIHSQDPPLLLGGFTEKNFVQLPDGRLRLTSYGLLRIFPPEQHARVVAGDPTLDPVPPDVHAAEDPSTLESGLHRRFDVWSLGALGARMLGASLPLAQSPPAGVDAELWDILHRCLGPGEGLRFETMSEAEKWLSGEAQRFAANPPRMVLRPPELRLTHAERESMILTGFAVANEGGGTLAGTATAAEAWLKVSPQSFEGNDQEIQVWVDTAQLDEVNEAKGSIRVVVPHEERVLAVHVTLQDEAPSIIPTWAAVLLILLVGLGPTAAVIYYKLNTWEMISNLQQLMGGSISVSPDAFALVARGITATRWLFLLALLVPVGVWGVLRLVSRSTRDMLRPAALIAMLLPAGLPWLLFKEKFVRLSGDVSRLLPVDPHYAQFVVIAMNAVFAILLFIPNERLPGPLGTSRVARALFWVFLLFVFLRMYYRYTVAEG